jgi:hypothetical protein
VYVKADDVMSAAGNVIDDHVGRYNAIRKQSTKG